jgi:hypothetical protein
VNTLYGDNNNNNNNNDCSNTNAAEKFNDRLENCSG